MKASLVTALAILGVLGMASAAVAINADILRGIDGGRIGAAIEVVVPIVSSTEKPAPRSVPDFSATPTEQNPAATSSSESSPSVITSPSSVVPALSDSDESGDDSVGEIPFDD